MPSDPTKVRCLLVDARTRLADPKAWLHGHPTASAVSSAGAEVEPQSPLATSWCVYGALVAGRGSDEDTDAALHAFASAVWPDDDVPTDWEALFILVSRWHDDPIRTHDDVLHALDRAVATQGGA